MVHFKTHQVVDVCFEPRKNQGCRNQVLDLNNLSVHSYNIIQHHTPNPDMELAYLHTLTLTSTKHPWPDR